MALELDPLTPTMSRHLAWVLYYARRYDESIAQLKKTLELAPEVGMANALLGWNYAQKRMYPEAVTECQSAVSLAPEEQVTLGSCGDVYGLAKGCCKTQRPTPCLTRVAAATAWQICWFA